MTKTKKFVNDPLHHCVQKVASQSPYSLPLFLPQPQVSDGDRVQQWCIKHMEKLSQHGFTAPTSVNLLSGNTYGQIKTSISGNLRAPLSQTRHNVCVCISRRTLQVLHTLDQVQMSRKPPYLSFSNLDWINPQTL